MTGFGALNFEGRDLLRYGNRYFTALFDGINHIASVRNFCILGGIFPLGTYDICSLASARPSKSFLIVIAEFERIASAAFN